MQKAAQRLALCGFLARAICVLFVTHIEFLRKGLGLFLNPGDADRLAKVKRDEWRAAEPVSEDETDGLGV